MCIRDRVSTQSTWGRIDSMHPYYQKQEKRTTRFNLDTSFQIFVRYPDGNLIALEVNASDTAKNLKKRIQVISKLEYNSFSLNYGGKLLLEHSLNDYNITSGSTIELVLSIKGGNMSFDLLEFNDLKSEIRLDVVQNVPAYRWVSPGLHLEGVCATSSCLAFQKKVLIPLGLGEFFINKMVAIACCPICKKLAHKVTNMGFFDCEYTISGVNAQGEAVNIENCLAFSDKYLSLIHI
eukprot:TRINITY_DN1044_c0_g1_i3.p1 TRINITY_DN1044_c0_g1~~TRINITY_DN1044_c0_g1_i3.p1  ORF type:complete len:236 (-),score=9.80 TRINITY_DN1044_c0_g1_i3:60-767(-)